MVVFFTTIKKGLVKMIKQALSCCFLFLLLAGCQKHTTQCSNYVAYTDEGTLKPRIALASVTDSSGTNLSWDVSDEIISGINYYMRLDGELNVIPQNDVYAKMALLGDIDPYAANLTPWKSFCNNDDFIVLIDVFKREELPYEKGKFSQIYCDTLNQSGNVLSLKARLKIIDIRAQQPKLVLYEVNDFNYMLPLGYENQQIAKWGDPDYNRTYIGKVHDRLICQLTQRINMVINDVR